MHPTAHCIFFILTSIYLCLVSRTFISKDLKTTWDFWLSKFLQLFNCIICIDCGIYNKHVLSFDNSYWCYLEIFIDIVADLHQIKFDSLALKIIKVSDNFSSFDKDIPRNNITFIVLYCLTKNIYFEKWINLFLVSILLLKIMKHIIRFLIIMYIPRNNFERGTSFSCSQK